VGKNLHNNSGTDLYGHCTQELVISPFFCVTMTMKVHMVTQIRCGLHTWASYVPKKDRQWW